MRMTADEVHQTGKTYLVHLDGEEVSDRCFIADEEEGYVDCYVMSKGHILFDEVENAPATERLDGKVVITEGIHLGGGDQTFEVAKVREIEPKDGWKQYEVVKDDD